MTPAILLLACHFARLALPFPVGRSQLIDVNQDGWLDLCVQNRVYLHQQDGSYAAGPTFPDNTAFMVWGDLDNDGRLDAISVVRQGPHQVFLNGNFAEPVATIQGDNNALCAVLADLDRDGFLDFAVGNSYLDEANGLDAGQMHVHKGTGDGHFRDVTEEWGFSTPGPPGAANAARPLFGLTACDLDNDGFPELLGAAYGRQWNTLWKRENNARYNECAAKHGLDGDSIRHGKYPDGSKRSQELPFRSNGNTFCLAAADYDGDGDWDVYSAEITHSWAGEASDLSTLLINRWPLLDRQLDNKPDPETGLNYRPGLGLTRHHAPQTPLKWNQGDLQAHWADLDQDGNIDLIVCESDYPHNRLRVFLQNPDHTFREGEDELGINFPNCPGVAIGDVDNDGDLDLVTTGTQTRWPEARKQPELALWLNHPDHPSLVVNVKTIGARVFLTTDQGKQSRQADGPYGHFGQQTQPGLVHFGLGTATPKSLRVLWPDGHQTVLTDLPARGTIDLSSDAR